ncbi:tRNA_edit domain-containing protein [Pycnococcus provasolii]
MDGASTVSYLLSSLSLSDTEVAFVSHAPVMTCEEASSVYNALTPPLSPPFCKNLFVKDKKGGLYLFICEDNTKVELAKIGARFGMGKGLRLADDSILLAALSVKPGGVTPLALQATQVPIRVIIDEKLRNAQRLHFHPQSGNDATVSLSAEDLVAFLKHVGREPTFVDLELKVAVSKDAPPDLAHLVAEKGAAEAALEAAGLTSAAGGGDGGAGDKGSAASAPAPSKAKAKAKAKGAAPAATTPTTNTSPSDPKTLTKRVLALVDNLKGEERERELELTLTLALADAYSNGLVSVCPKPNLRCL